MRKEPGAERFVALRFIFAKNILCDGVDDAVGRRRADEWDFIKGMKPKREDYRLGQLMRGQGQHGITLDMFDWEEDAGTGILIPSAFQPLTIGKCRRRRNKAVRQQLQSGCFGMSDGPIERRGVHAAEGRKPDVGPAAAGTEG